MLNMLIGYLVFIIVVSLLVSLLVSRLKRPSPRLIILLIVLVLGLPFLAGYFYTIYFNSIPDVTMPDLKGLPLTVALEQLKLSQLKGRVGGSIAETEITTGAVVSQRPEAGRLVKVGRTVNLLVSAKVEKVQVPNLLGQPADKMAELLGEKGLQLQTVSYEYGAGIDAGLVISQLPLPGETVEAGSGVEVTVSTFEGGAD